MNKSLSLVCCISLLPILGGNLLLHAADNRPNFLICVADDASYPHMSAYGCPWIHTPGFDRVAREGLLFTHAYTPNAKCAPSRACLLTGRNPWQLKAACNHWCYFPTEFKTYPEVLAQFGYYVGKTGKGWAPGIARTKDGKPRHLTGTPFDRRKTRPPTRGISSNDYAANFKDFLDSLPPGKPFCFWYGGHEPHRRYEFRSGITKGGKSIDQIDRVPPWWPDNETVRTDMLDYAFEIEWFDQHLVRMLKLLEERGLLDNTVVIVTSDNGMPFPRAKGQEYEISNHMPLAIMWKRGIRNPGRVIDDYVSFIDIAPTLIELAGLRWDQTGMAPSPGRSLTDIFFSTRQGRVNPARDHVLIGKERHDVGRPHDWGYPIRGIIKDEMIYLRNFEPTRWPAGNPETGYLNCDGSPTKTEVLRLRREGKTDRYWNLCFGKRPAEELYCLRSDPFCIHNLANNPAWQAVKQRLSSQLFRELLSQDDPRMYGQGSIFERYPYANAKNRNFYERFMRGERLPSGWVNPSDFEPKPIR